MGRKYTERKKARMTLTPLSSSARPRESTNVSGTMNAAKIVNVIRLSRNGPGLQQVDVVLQPDPVARGHRVLGAREAQDHRPDDRHIDEDHQTDDERPDEQPERACDARRSGLWPGVPAALRPPPAPSGSGRTCQPNSRVSSALTAFSALARFASMSPPLRTIAVAASAYALFIFGVQAGLPATA